jgi:hypothetical protein
VKCVSCFGIVCCAPPGGSQGCGALCGGSSESGRSESRQTEGSVTLGPEPLYEATKRLVFVLLVRFVFVVDFSTSPLCLCWYFSPETFLYLETFLYFAQSIPANAAVITLRSQYSDSLRAGRSGDRIPVGTRFSAPVQTGRGAHQALYTMGTVSFPGVKRPGRGVNHPPPSNTELKERV